jgi:hypothetical protein
MLLLGAPEAVMAANPTCFISYSWDSHTHERWVRKLAEALIANGVSVHLDVFETHLGSNLPEYMERCVRDSDFVILVCTPRYAERANERKGGVGFETSIVTGEVFETTSAIKKFVPLLRGEDPSKSLPTYLKGRKYLDARSRRSFRKYLKQLVYHLWDRALILQPPLGPQPEFAEPLIPKPLSTTEVSRVITRVEKLKNVDEEIRRKEEQLENIGKMHRAASSRRGARLWGDRADFISKLGVELDALRKRKSELEGHPD